MTFDSLQEFRRDLKKLLKRYHSLEEDLEVLRQVLRVYPDARPPISFHINGLGIETCVIKVKKIACKSLKGRGVNSGLRLVYAWFETEERITFIELYHKADQEGEDREQIKRYFE